MSPWPLVGRAGQLDRVVAVLTSGRGRGRPPAAGPRAAGPRAAGSRMAGTRTAGLLVAGPAGVGKTRLLAEARRRAGQAGVPVHWAVATAAAAGIPFGAFAHLIPADAAGADLTSLLTATTARLTGDSAPAAVAVDDVHSLDPASAALVEHLLVNTGVPVVLTVRTGDVGTTATWAWLRDLERVELSPLSESEVAEVLAAALDGPVESALPAAVTRLSQGNPLLARELVQAALAGTALRREGGVWRMTGPLVAASTLPATIEARLERLPPAVRAAAELLALAEPIDAVLLERVLTAELIAALEEEKLLGEVDDSGGLRRVGLTHPLYGEALRATMPPMRARRHRRALAEAAEAAEAAGTAETAESAGVAERQDRVRVALWRLDGGLPVDPRRLVEAAREAAGRLDHELAGRLAQAAVAAGGGFEAALALLPELPYQGRGEQALALADELARDIDDPRDRIRLATVRANVELVLGQVDQARRTLADAAAQTADPADRLRLAVQQAAQAFSTGHIGLCVELGDEVVGRRDLDPAMLAQLAISRVRALSCAGRTRDAIALAEQVLGSPDEQALRSPEEQAAASDAPAAGQREPPSARRALVGMTLLQALAQDGQLQRAAAVGTAGLAESRGGPAAALRAFWTHELGQVSLLAGHAGAATRWLRETLAVMPLAGLPAAPQLWSLDGLTEAAALLGEADEAARQADRLRAALPPGFVAPRCSGAVWAVAAAGQLTDAQRLAVRHATTLTQVGSSLMAACVLHDAARLGGAATVDRQLAGLARSCQGDLVPAMAANAAALAARDPAALDRAASRFAGLGCHLYAAECATQAARLYRRAGRSGPALSAAARAELHARQCGPVHTPLLAGSPLTDPLTAREREVAQLAARGITDRAIAERLHLSPRTVQSHLYRTYRKLGIGDRAALTAILADGRGVPRP
jgi:DNA-binding CsgD family transcriptional regulator